MGASEFDSPELILKVESDRQSSAQEIEILGLVKDTDRTFRSIAIRILID
jgi:hypothetical protein